MINRFLLGPILSPTLFFYTKEKQPAAACDADTHTHTHTTTLVEKAASEGL